MTETTYIRIGEVAELVRGISFPKESKSRELTEDSVACLRTTNVQKSVEWDDVLYVPKLHVKKEAQYLRPNDILVSMSNSLELVGKSAIVKSIPFNSTFGAFIAALRVSSAIDARYVYYMINSPQFLQHLRSIASTTTNISNINGSKLEASEIPFVSLSEQRRTVSKIEELFSDLDDGEAALQRVHKLLGSYRRAVLKAAVTGELTKAWREANYHRLESGEELLQRILAERQTKWEATNLGKKYNPPAKANANNLPPLPVGWYWVTIDQLGAVGTGATPLRSNDAYYHKGHIPWVTSEVVNKPYVESADEYITPLALAETNAKLFPSGTLLVAMYGEGKTRGKTTELRISAATNQALAAIQLDGEAERCKPYVKLFLQGNYESIRLLSSGGVQPNLNLSIIRHTALPFPPPAEQNEIVSKADDMLSRISVLGTWCATELVRSNTLRQSILKAAFSGTLVPQDSTTKPASVLLGRIQGARQSPSPNSSAGQPPAKAESKLQPSLWEPS